LVLCILFFAHTQPDNNTKLQQIVDDYSKSLLNVAYSNEARNQQQQQNNQTIRRKNKMGKTTTTNLFTVSINDLKHGGALGVVWLMSNQEIEQFNNDNAGNLQAVVINN
jgi:hypothetical protein